jgi:hypothetical protein
VEDVACLTAPPTLAPLLKGNIPVPGLGFSTGDRPWADFARRRGTDLVVEKASQSLKPSPSRRWRWGRQVYDRKMLPFGLKPGLASFTASSTLESTGSSRTLAIFEARRTLAIFEARVLGEEVLVVFQVLYSPHFLRFSRSKKGKIYFNL